MARCSKQARAQESGNPNADNAPVLAAQADSGLNTPTGNSEAKSIPAARFAALVGRDLRTLSNWDEAGITHPEVRRSRRYYATDDIKAVLKLGGGRKGARPGSPIKYL
jgi:hypothetical protein